MYARSTILIADPQRLDDGIAEVRDNVMPAVLDMDGCIGLSMLCNRVTGRCIVTTAWGSHEAMAASRPRVREMRDRATGMLGSVRSEVQEWEIAALHRLHPAGDEACARVTWTRGDPAETGRAIDAFRMSILPRVDEIPGFCSLSLMVDRETGIDSVTAVYADRASLEASREQVAGMREEFSRQMDTEVTEVAEMDVVIHHLRVPELV